MTNSFSKPRVSHRSEFIDMNKPMWCVTSCGEESESYIGVGVKSESPIDMCRSEDVTANVCARHFYEVKTL